MKKIKLFKIFLSIKKVLYSFQLTKTDVNLFFSTEWFLIVNHFYINFSLSNNNFILNNRIDFVQIFILFRVNYV